LICIPAPIAKKTSKPVTGEADIELVKGGIAQQNVSITFITYIRSLSVYKTPAMSLPDMRTGKSEVIHVHQL
jgi:hypothetical protein